MVSRRHMLFESPSSVELRCDLVILERGGSQTHTNPADTSPNAMSRSVYNNQLAR